MHPAHVLAGRVIFRPFALQDALVLGLAREGGQVVLGLTGKVHPVEPPASAKLLCQREGSMIMAMMPPGLSHALMARSLLGALVRLNSSSFWMSHARRQLLETAMPGLWGADA